MPDVDVTVPVPDGAPATVASLASKWVDRVEAKAAEAPPKEQATEAPEGPEEETTEAAKESTPKDVLRLDMASLAAKLGVDEADLKKALPREFQSLRHERSKAREKVEKAEALLAEATQKATEAESKLKETSGLYKEVARMVEYGRAEDYATAAEVFSGLDWEEYKRRGDAARSDPARAEIAKMRREIEQRQEAEAKAREAADAEHRTRAQQAEFEQADKHLASKLAAIGGEFEKLSEKHAFRRFVQAELEKHWDGRETISVRQAAKLALDGLRREHGEWSSVLGSTTGQTPEAARGAAKKNPRSISGAQSGGAAPTKASSVRDVAAKWVAKHGG